jgi:hypothetical protein
MHALRYNTCNAANDCFDRQETVLSGFAGYQLPKGSWTTPTVDNLLLAMHKAGIVEHAVKRNKRHVMKYNGRHFMSVLPDGL